MTTAIDLFAGLGGWSTGARAAGVQVLWAANHWPVAVEWHSTNHPDMQHVCQDLHQARWEQMPAQDILLASPCCFLDFYTWRWSQIEKPGRAQATLERVRNGRQRLSDRFIMPYY